MNSKTQRARLKGIVLGVTLATGLVIGGGKVANAVDPMQCVSSEISANEIKVVLKQGVEAVTQQLSKDTYDYVMAGPDKVFYRMVDFEVKYECFFSRDELREIRREQEAIRKLINSGASREEILKRAAAFSEGLAKRFADRMAIVLTKAREALQGQAFKIGTRQSCTPCAGKLIKAGSKETLKKVGIGLLGAAIGAAASKAFGAYGYINDATQCGMNDMIQIEYTEVQDEFACQEAKRFDCPSRSKSRADCGMCCKFDLPTWSPSAQQQCEQSCKDKFPSKYCSNRAGQRIELKDQKNGTYQGECDSK